MKDVNQHKQMAMGQKVTGMKSGGRVPMLKTGTRDTPQEAAKRSNGVVGMKKGGRC